MIAMRSGILLLSVIVTAGLAVAQGSTPPTLFERPFGEIDLDDDQLIDKAEFDSAVDARFVQLDADTRGVLRPEDMPTAERTLLRVDRGGIEPGRYQTLYDAQFRLRDANHDGHLTPPEWR